MIKYYGVDPEKIKVINNAADHIKKVKSFVIPNEEKKMLKSLKINSSFLLLVLFMHKNIERFIAAMRMLNSNEVLVVVGSTNAYYNALKKNMQMKKSISYRMLACSSGFFV